LLLVYQRTRLQTLRFPPRSIADVHHTAQQLVFNALPHRTAQQLMIDALVEARSDIDVQHSLDSSSTELAWKHRGSMTLSSIARSTSSGSMPMSKRSAAAAAIKRLDTLLLFTLAVSLPEAARHLSAVKARGGRVGGH
jgi:hypothetical protein